LEGGRGEVSEGWLCDDPIIKEVVMDGWMEREMVRARTDGTLALVFELLVVVVVE